MNNLKKKATLSILLTAFLPLLGIYKKDVNYQTIMLKKSIVM